MSNDADFEKAKATQTPADNLPSDAEQKHGSDAMPSASDRNEADWAGRPEDDGRTVKVGARDIDHPTDTRPEPNDPATEAGNLYDRLAKRDQTPVDDGGSSSLA